MPAARAVRCVSATATRDADAAGAAHDDDDAMLLVNNVYTTAQASARCFLWRWRIHYRGTSVIDQFEKTEAFL